MTSNPPDIKKLSNKPLYKVPSMEEIRSLPWNGFNAVSTFSGCGGSSLGYRMAGFKILWASEFIEAARDSYNANKADYTILDHRDIREVKADDILNTTGLSVGDIDLFDGSPPCASFSTAGKRQAGWGQVKNYSDTKQRTDDLFFEYARLIRDTQPKTFVAENVSGLIKGAAKGYFLEILKVLKGCGYNVKAKLLDAQWLGVPQARQRLIFVGVRNDLGLEPCFPTPLKYRYTVRDALPWIVNIETRNGKFTTAQAPGRAVRASDGGRSSTGLEIDTGYIEAETDISRYAIGREWDNLKQGESTYYGGRLWKPDVNKPCPTVTQRGGDNTAASVTHPTEKRKFSIAELKRICAFPDDFQLTGTYSQQWERLGRAVPPVMMAAIATSVRDGILKKI